MDRPLDPPLPKDPVALKQRLDALRPRLLLFATRHCADHMDPEEMVHRAIQSVTSAVLTGEGRRWKPEKCSLVTFMLNAVSSVISHEFASGYTERHAGSIHRDDGDDLEPAPPSNTTPEEMHRTAAREARGRARVAAIEARLSPVAIRVFRAMQEPDYDPCALADELEVDVKKIYRACESVKDHAQAVLDADPDSSGPQRALEPPARKKTKPAKAGRREEDES